MHGEEHPDSFIGKIWPFVVNFPQLDIAPLRTHPDRSQKCLDPLMFGAGDDLILQGVAEVAEVVAVAGHAHDQVAVLLGVGLGGAQRGGIDHVELDVVPVQLEIRADQVDQLGQALSDASTWGVNFWLSKRAACAHVVHFGGGLQHGSGAVAVGALHRGDPFRERGAGLAPVRRGADHRTEIDMHGGGQQVDVVHAALGVGSAVYGIEIGFERRAASAHRRSRHRCRTWGFG